MAVLGGCGEQGSDVFEGFALRTFEALSELFECCCFDANEFGWAAVVGLGEVGHCVLV